MPNVMKKGHAALVAEAEAEISTLTPQEASAMHEAGDAILIDVRDIRELSREGRIPDARHCPRGMLEFWVDPESPYHKPVFSEDKTFVFFCAAGWRSALATKSVQDMGLERVAHIGGGFGAWREAGLPIEKEQPDS